VLVLSLNQDRSSHLRRVEFTIEGKTSSLAGCDCYVRVLDRTRFGGDDHVICVGCAYGERVVLVGGVVEVNVNGVTLVDHDEV